MLVEIDTHSGVPIFRQMQDQIRRQIVGGQMESGEQLPTVRELSARLRVNPMTVSKVYGLLEMEGLVERRRGIGLFVASGNARKIAAVRSEFLDEALSNVALLAVQLSIPEAEVMRSLERVFSELNRNRQRKP
jgi:GntR family transcriptional regulator